MDTELLARLMARLTSRDVLIEASSPVSYLLLTLAIFLIAAYKARAWPSPIGYLKFVLPPSGWKTSSAWVDVLFYILNKLTDGLRAGFYIILKVFLASTGAGLLAASFGPPATTPATLPVLAACYVLIFVIGDFAHYVTHYVEHRIPTLWELHKVHHSATFMSPLTKYRQHPIEDVFNNLLPITALAVPLSIMRYAWLTDIQVAVMLASVNLAGLLVAFDPFRHSHIPLSYGIGDKVLLSPTMHQLHHSSNPDHFDKNFGRYLSIWDRMFGTVQDVVPNQAIIVGMGNGEDHEYRSAVACLFLPLVKIGRRFAGRSRDRAPGGAAEWEATSLAYAEIRPAGTSLNVGASPSAPPHTTPSATG